MLEIDHNNISTPDLQKYLLSSIGPRPIALASTIDANGVNNVSPFSFFNIFSGNPPIALFSPAKHVARIPGTWACLRWRLGVATHFSLAESFWACLTAPALCRWSLALGPLWLWPPQMDQMKSLSVWWIHWSPPAGWAQ